VANKNSVNNVLYYYKISLPLTLKMRKMAQETKNQEKQAEQEVNTVQVDGIHLKAANSIVKRNMWYAAGFGIIPIPFVEIVGTGAMQLKMVASLCKEYNTPFSQEIGRGIIATLLGTLSAVGVAAGAATLLKSIPLVGGILSGASFAITGAAATYAVGKIFIQHFEAGGTMLTFNPEKMKAYFKELYEEGKQVAQSMAQEAKATVV
jgi:uncharacterized protein (DUF697 family)